MPLPTNVLATNISVAADPSNSANTIITFTRNDTNQQVQLSAPVTYVGSTNPQILAALEVPLEAFLAQIDAANTETNLIAAINTLASGKSISATG